jgi:hypothetical protein
MASTQYQQHRTTVARDLQHHATDESGKEQLGAARCLTGSVTAHLAWSSSACCRSLARLDFWSARSPCI